MDFIQKILCLQNDELLVRIAIDKFDDKINRKKFIQKYDKLNFRKLKITKNKVFKSYQTRIIKL
tara:strand:- start:15 stop:206 length:192 start_codon:yes stop_codon:yes gene_type:complete